MDKRQTQISLPLHLPEREFKEQVKQHWNITFARQGRISVYGKRMMALVLGQIRDNDTVLKPYYQMNISDIVRHADLSGNSKSPYGIAKKALDELAMQLWRIEDVQTKTYRPKQLINTMTSQIEDGFEYGYEDGIITIVINPHLEPYFVEMAHYTTFQVDNYMKFKSWYSMRFWEILSAYKDTGKWYVPLEDYRSLMDCEKKYKDVNRLIEVTTTEPLEELKGTPLEFTFEKVFKKFSGRGRPPVIGLNFDLITSKLTIEQTLEKWKKSSPEHNEVITELNTKWKIPPATLVKYLPVIKMDGAKKLINSFKKKDHPTSIRKIDDRAKFCSSAIKKASMLIDPTIK